ncbi:MAG: hypothetical protein WA151_15905 [Desulfatirhabdiaceae bacterium]
MAAGRTASGAVVVEGRAGVNGCGKTIVKARAFVCYWAVRELGMSMTEVAKHLKIALSTASSAVKA